MCVTQGPGWKGLPTFTYSECAKAVMVGGAQPGWTSGPCLSFPFSHAPHFLCQTWLLTTLAAKITKVAPEKLINSFRSCRTGPQEKTGLTGPAFACAGGAGQNLHKTSGPRTV